METCNDYNKSILKLCTKCNKRKTLDNFPKKKDHKYGRYSHCKKCKAITDHIYQMKNRKKIRIRYTKWAKNNREIINKASRKYYYKNREKHMILTKNRRAKAKNAEGSFTEQEWENLKKEYNYKCAICKNTEPFNQFRKYLTIDHIIPLSKGGTNYITNIQPLCFVCNSIKKDKGIV